MSVREGLENRTKVGVKVRTSTGGRTGEGTHDGSRVRHIGNETIRDREKVGYILKVETRPSNEERTGDRTVGRGFEIGTRHSDEERIDKTVGVVVKPSDEESTGEGTETGTGVSLSDGDSTGHKVGGET